MTSKNLRGNLKIIDAEIYEAGLKVLSEKLGTAGMILFLRQCEPGTGSFTEERKKWIADEPDIRTIAKRIQQNP